MALFNTLRNKMGTLVVTVIFVSLFAFILTDFLSQGNLFTGNDNVVGEIAGQDVGIEEFQNLIALQESNYYLSFGRQPGEREKPTLRNQAWELLIAEYAFQKQYDKVGVKVSAEEIDDMVYGKNISPSIQQAFTNPQTGEFDRSALMGFLNNMNPQQRVSWEMFYKDLEPGRERIKFENLLVKTSYVTAAEAEMEYKMQNDVAELRYLYIPYYAIGDSAVTVDEAAVTAYYNDHKEEYETDELRSLSYVNFPVIPSATDTAYTLEEVMEIKEEFKSAANDSLYAGTNTDALNNFFSTYQPGSVPLNLRDTIATLSKGEVIGPMIEGDGYVLYKLSDVYEDTVSYAKASHILIQEDDDAAGKAKAERLLRELQNGANFSAYAAEHGTDGTASRGGDLGWFSTGKMVAEFEDAVFNATSTGLLNRVVKTQFGYHIIRIDETKTNTVYKMATVRRNILPSDETINVAFRKADLFATEVSDLESFEAQAEAEGLNVVKAENLGKNARRVGVLGDARQIVQWLYRDASTDETSEVFDLGDSYVVAVMTGEVEEGFKPLSAVRTEVEAKVKSQLKGDVIVEKLTGLSGTLDEMAAAYGADANVYESSDLKLSSNTLPTVGFDPELVGKIFAMEAGSTSEPIKGENGVVVVNLQNITTAPEIADYSIYKNQLNQSRANRASFSISEAIKENADIKDYRYKFY